MTLDPILDALAAAALLLAVLSLGAALLGAVADRLGDTGSPRSGLRAARAHAVRPVRSVASRAREAVERDRLQARAHRRRAHRSPVRPPGGPGRYRPSARTARPPTAHRSRR